MRTGLVFDLRRNSAHDGPGIRTSVFLKGCPLACPWCHNPEGRAARPEILKRPDRCVGCLSCAAACPLGLDPRAAAGSPACAACPDFGACARACPAEALQEVGRRMSVEEVMAEIRADRAFYEASGGGATFTGGEPLAQAGFLGELLDACRAEGIHSAVETSGYATEEVVLDIGRRADLLLFDLKQADRARGSAQTGVDYGLCLDNLAALAAAGAEEGGYARLVLRLPIVPGMNDDAEELRAAAELAAGLPSPFSAEGRRRGREVHLLPYHDSARGKYTLWGLDYALEGRAVPEAGAMAAARDLFAARGLEARIGG